jgi:hypothetical protein
MGEVDMDMKRLITRYRIAFCLPFVLVLICSFIGMPLTGALIFLLAIFFLTGVSIIGFLCFLRREYAFAAEGLVCYFRPKALFTGMIFIFFR